MDTTHIDTRVEAYFQANHRIWSRSWDSAIGELGEEEESAREYERVQRPGFGAEEIAAFLNTTGFGTSDTAALQAFLGYGTYGRVSCDGFLEFFRTTSFETWTKKVEAFSFLLDTRRFLPFATDDYSRAFCLERTGDGVVVSIVDEGNTCSKVFSSFEALLDVMTTVLNADVVLSVPRGASPDALQRALVSRLREIDPSGFGAVGWPRWFQGKVGGTGW
jgi:hypothetical protein